MQVERGGQYAIRLRLANAEHLDESWLIGAMLLRYPGASVVAIEGYDGQQAVIRFGWRSAPAEIRAGDEISPAIEGLPSPQEALPLGEVETATVLVLPEPEADGRIGEGVQLLLAGGLLVAVWLLVRRIRI